MKFWKEMSNEEQMALIQIESDVQNCINGSRCLEATMRFIEREVKRLCNHDLVPVVEGKDITRVEERIGKNGKSYGFWLVHIPTYGKEENMKLPPVVVDILLNHGWKAVRSESWD